MTTSLGTASVALELLARTDTALPQPLSVTAQDIYGTLAVTLLMDNADDVAAWADALQLTVETYPHLGRTHTSARGTVYDLRVNIIHVSDAKVVADA